MNDELPGLLDELRETVAERDANEVNSSRRVELEARAQTLAERLAHLLQTRDVQELELNDELGPVH